MKSLIAAAILLVFATAGNAGAAQGSLSAAEIRALVAGNEMTATNSYGVGYSLEFDADGKWTGRCTSNAMNLGSRYCTSDSGTWAATKDDQFCITYHAWQSGKTACGPLSAKGDNYSWSTAGSGATVTFTHPMKPIASPAPSPAPSR
jgi:hypothetical protein